MFNDEEVRSILKATEGDRFEALYKLAIGTGARQGELFALEREDFDLTAGTVRIVKTLDQRADSLPTFALEAVRRHIEGRQASPVFTTGDGNYPLRSNFIRKDWAPLLEKAGVKYRKFHTTRHTHASRLLAAGVDPAEVARRIGDKIETLMRVYAHWVPAETRNTAAKVDAIYAEQPKPKPESYAGTWPREVHARPYRGGSPLTSGMPAADIASSTRCTSP